MCQQLHLLTSQHDHSVTSDGSVARVTGPGTDQLSPCHIQTLHLALLFRCIIHWTMHVWQHSPDPGCHQCHPRSGVCHSLVTSPPCVTLPQILLLLSLTCICLQMFIVYFQIFATIFQNFPLLLQHSKHFIFAQQFTTSSCILFCLCDLSIFHTPIDFISKI